MESAMHQEKRQILPPKFCLFSMVSCDYLHNCRWPNIIPPTATVVQSLVLGKGCDLTPLLQQLISLFNYLHYCLRLWGWSKNPSRELKHHRNHPFGWPCSPQPHAGATAAAIASSASPRPASSCQHPASLGGYLSAFLL